MITGSLYPILPVFLQNAACSFYGLTLRRLRFSKQFQQKLEQLKLSEWYSKEQIEEYQSEQLKILIRHAFDHVPYYRATMKQLGLSPEDIQSKEDLPKLPLLTKDIIRARFREFIADNASEKKLVHGHTSGTTGASLQYYLGRNQVPFQWAVWWRHRARFGIRPDMLHANFTGKPVVPPATKRPPYWRWNLPMNQALIPMQQIQPEKISDLVKFLGDHPFAYYSGYPSIIDSFSSQALDQGLTLQHRPSCVFTGAENILDQQRQNISKFTGALLSDQYGFSEGCGNASRCEHGIYHEDFEFGILECVEPEIIDDGNTKGKIICTGFANPEFPFIRYDVGDNAVWDTDFHACECGRQSRKILRIEGRSDEYILTPEGRKIMRFDYLFKDTRDIRECQIVQKQLGEMTIKIVRRDGYQSSTEDMLRNGVRQWISPKLKVNFEYVSEIERTGNGKMKAVISLLNAQKTEIVV